MPYRTRWWRSLSAEVAGVITVTAILGGVVLIVVVLGAQRRLLTEQSLSNAAFLSDTIVSGLQRHMLHNERTEIAESLREIGAQPFMTEVRLLDSTGLTHFSTIADEIGRTATTRDGACAACHGNGHAAVGLDVRERSRIVRMASGRMLATVTPIYNRPACSTAACHAHSPDQRVLGVLEVGMSLSQVDARMATLQQTTGTVACVTLIALCAVTIVFTRRRVLAPVDALFTGIKRVEDGDHPEPVRVTGGGEIAGLAAAFNTMEASLHDAREQRQALLDGLERQVRERTTALEQAQERLIRGEKLSSIGRLSASIAHEINNPLAGILTYTKLLLRMVDTGPPDERARAAIVERLRIIEREARRCSQIVRSLLDFARAGPMTIGAVDVNAAIEEAALLIGNQAALQNIVVHRDLQPLSSIDADFGQVRQALLNVLINACDAMTGGGALAIGSRQTADGGVEVVVRDTGGGIAPEHLQKVMDPFFTTKQKGTGLGLSVVYGIVERHGGRFTIDSTMGAGTTVTIALPRRADGDAGRATGTRRGTAA